MIDNNRELVYWFTSGKIFEASGRQICKTDRLNHATVRRLKDQCVDVLSDFMGIPDEDLAAEIKFWWDVSDQDAAAVAEVMRKHLPRAIPS